jgi:hypothetical protein
MGKSSSPLELLILGALRYLGRGCTFDDCAENTTIGEETHRVFFHSFTEIGSTVFFRKYILTPATAEELLQHQHETAVMVMVGQWMQRMLPWKSAPTV